jgi:hypothetical protein
MLPFQIGSLNKADLEALVESKVSEGRTMEFKRELPGKADADRKEFLADVTSLANAEGGVILFGVATARDVSGKDTGVAEEIAGIAGLVSDQEIQRMEAMLRDGVEPPITAQVRFQAVECQGGATVLALGVFRSFAAPHQVVYAGSRRFWVRGHAGKYEPDVNEMRQMFLTSASWLKRADDFRRERLSLLPELPGVDLSSIFLIHVLPLRELEAPLDVVANERALQVVPPMERGSGWNHRFNVDGFVTFNQAYETKLIISYTQWFRTGGAEGFSSGYVRMTQMRPGEAEKKMIWMTELVSASTEWVENIVKVLESSLLIAPPFAIILTLRGVLNAEVPTRSIFNSHRIQRDSLLLPPVLYDPARSSLKDALAPLFAMLAQSAGLSKPPDM